MRNGNKVTVVKHKQPSVKHTLTGLFPLEELIVNKISTLIKVSGTLSEYE